MSKVILSEITTLGEQGTLRVSPGTKIDLSKSNSYLQLPRGTTAQRPLNATSGELRYNTDTKLVEYYDGSEWQEIEVPEDYDDITKAGLVLHLDASNEESYPGSGSRWYDLTSYQNNSDLINGPTYQDINGGVISFDGVDDRGFVSNNLAPGTGDFTISVWVYKTDTVQNRYIWDFGSNGGTLSTGTSITGGFRYYNPTSGTSSVLYTSGPPHLVNTWYNIVVSRRSNITTIYSNGVAYVSASDTGNIGTWGTSLTIGNYGGGGNYNHLGYLSNFQIYDRALTPGEIWKNYVALAPRFGINPIPDIPTNGLVLHLDAANYQSYPRSGTTWYDLSGNNNHVEMDASLVPVFQDNLVFRVNNGANFETTSANISLNTITMVAWYKAITRGGGFSTRVLETHKTGTTVSYSHALAPDGDGTLRAWVESGNTTSYNRISSTDATEVYPLNEWIMMAYTHDGSNGRLYVNGKNTLTVAGSASVLDDINIITIGAIPDFNTYQHNQYYMDAEISKVMIYTRALSGSEIQQLFNNLRTRHGI